MRILFTADLHSDKVALQHFVHVLDTRDFEIGVIAGDLTEGSPRPDLLKKEVEADPDDVLMELYDPDVPEDRAFECAFSQFFSRDGVLQKAYELEEQELKGILHLTRKPILLVIGNHDKTEWTSEGNIYNIHFHSAKVGKFNFVGFKDTEFNKDESVLAKSFEKVKPFIREHTILVTHIPALRTLDENSRGENIGSEALLNFCRRVNPLLHLFGHVHESAGIKGRSINGSFPPRRVIVGIDLQTDKVDLIEDRVEPSFPQDMRGSFRSEEALNQGLQRLSLQSVLPGETGESLSPENRQAGQVRSLRDKGSGKGAANRNAG